MKKLSEKKGVLILLLLSFVGLQNACSLVLDSESLIVPCGSNIECREKLSESFYCANGACVPKDESSADESEDAGN